MSWRNNSSSPSESWPKKRYKPVITRSSFKIGRRKTKSSRRRWKANSINKIKLSNTSRGKSTTWRGRFSSRSRLLIICRTSWSSKNKTLWRAKKFSKRPSRRWKNRDRPFNRNGSRFWKSCGTRRRSVSNWRPSIRRWRARWNPGLKSLPPVCQERRQRPRNLPHSSARRPSVRDHAPNPRCRAQSHRFWKTPRSQNRSSRACSSSKLQKTRRSPSKNKGSWEPTAGRKYICKRSRVSKRMRYSNSWTNHTAPFPMASSTSTFSSRATTASRPKRIWRPRLGNQTYFKIFTTRRSASSSRPTPKTLPISMMTRKTSWMSSPLNRCKIILMFLTIGCRAFSEIFDLL